MNMVMYGDASSRMWKESLVVREVHIGVSPMRTSGKSLTKRLVRNSEGCLRQILHSIEFVNFICIVPHGF